MASGTKQKNINAINNGEEFVKGKQVSRSSLNAIVNNTLYTQEKVDNRFINGGLITKGDKGDVGVPPRLFFATKELSTSENISIDQNGSAYTIGFPKGKGSSRLEGSRLYGSLYYITGNEDTTYDKTYEVFYQNFPIERTVFTGEDGNKVEFLQYSVEIPLNENNRPITKRYNFYLATDIDYNKYIAIPITSSSFNAGICAIENEDINIGGVGKLHLRMRTYYEVDNLPTESGKTIYNFMVILISK